MPTKAVHTSVPPEIELTCTPGPTASWTQRKPSAGSGAPVEPTRAQPGEVEVVARREARPCGRP